MRIVRLSINHWRNLRDVDLEIQDQPTLVCLIGENGTGKSAILELLSAVSHHLGISQGVELPRGDPFSEEHDVTVLAQLPADDPLLQDEALTNGAQPAGGSWNGGLRLTSMRDSAMSETSVTAEGIPSPHGQRVGERVVKMLRHRNETQHLYLDADRSYPPVKIEPHRYGEIWTQDWSSPKFTRNWAYRPTRTLYEEWMKYFIGVEERSAAEHITGIRRARYADSAEPVFVDPFDSYRDALREVLPHLHFVGVESTGQRRMPIFDSAGLELSFSKLSGGEREVSFLIGQIDRFKLQRGLLLIDEPELHLNPDLLRNWLAFLRNTITDGQIWIATHSLEAVEVAGPNATFVFERDRDDRIVRAPSTLAGRPVLSALSAAVGSPAFAISRLRFVYIEGDRQSRERERFFAVCGEADQNRFLEGGSCSEVLRRLDDVRELAYASGEQLHIGAVLDRDFRSDAEADKLMSEDGVHVLACHEIENVFLQPEALEVLLDRAGRAHKSAGVIVQEAADYHAGLWIAQRAASILGEGMSLPKKSIGVLSDERWVAIDIGWAEVAQRSTANCGPDERDSWSQALNLARDEYRTTRDDADLYRRCLGKQCLSGVATALGFRSAEALEAQVIRLWDTGKVDRPQPVIALRDYVSGLTSKWGRCVGPGPAMESAVHSPVGGDAGADS